MIRTVVAALLVAAALPAAATTSRPARPIAVEAEDPLARGLADFARHPGVETFRAARQAGLRHAGFAGPRADAAGAHGQVISNPVGDFDGDRVADLVDVFYEYPGPGYDTGRSTLRARRGVDGRVLWSRSSPLLLSVIEARVGPNAVPGVLLITISRPDATGTETVTLTAVDGRGTTMWEQSFTGVLAETPEGFGGAGSPFVTAVFDGLPGAASETLVTLYDFAYSTAGLNGVARTLVVDGATGLTTRVGATDVDTGNIPFVLDVPDLSGDGLGDVLVVAPSWEVGRIAVYQASGVPVWAHAGAGVLFGYPLGDVTGDGLGEIGALSVDGLTGADTTAVLSGAGGTELTRIAGQPFGIGDVDRDGRGDMRVLTASVDQSTHRVMIVVTAYRADGSRLYERRMTGPVVTASTHMGIGHAGDVQPDGVIELMFQVIPANGGGVAEGLMDGRTGTMLRQRRPYRGLYDAVDGRGDDFAEPVRSRPGVVTVTAQQGTTLLPLWRATIRHPAAGTDVFATAARLDGDRCADVVVDIMTGTNALLVALRGRDGRLMWARELTLSSERPFTGVTTGPDRNAGC